MNNAYINGIEIEDYLPLAHSIAFVFARDNLSLLDDYFSIAQAALLRAAERYSQERGDFSSYSGTAMRHAILNEIRRRKNQPSGVSLDDIDCNPEAVQIAAEEYLNHDPSRILADKDRDELLGKICRELESRQITALEMLASGSSLAQIAAKLGVSKTMAHKIVHAALDNVREAMKVRNIESYQLFSQSSQPVKFSLDLSVTEFHGSTSKPKPLKFNFDTWAANIAKGTKTKKTWWQKLTGR
jgi:RNA polymerase sigma factor (sigma-70 family)